MVHAQSHTSMDAYRDVEVLEPGMMVIACPVVVSLETLGDKYLVTDSKPFDKRTYQWSYCYLKL